MTPGEEQQLTGDVLAAATALVQAFAAHDAPSYFAAFDPTASFIFHTTPGVLPDRASYERLWREWEGEGFRVLGCESREPTVALAGADTAVFVHRVRTRLAGADAPLAERETIVFRRTGGRWLAVHEHLSPDPDEA